MTNEKTAEEIAADVTLTPQTASQTTLGESKDRQRMLTLKGSDIVNMRVAKEA